MSIHKKLKNLADVSDAFSSSDLSDFLLDIIYEENAEKTLEMFLKIQEKDRKRIKKENLALYHGLEDGMHNFASLASGLLENKTSRQAKASAHEMLEGDNPAYLISIFKPYFPKGTSKGASQYGKWLFEKFKDMLVRNKEKYQENGEDYGWAKMHDHLDYINLVISKAEIEVVDSE